MNLLTPAKPSEKSYDDLKEALRLHFKPKALVIAERFRFYQRNQQAGESVMRYLVVLEHLTGRCEFGTFLDEALRDKLVCGLRNKAIQKRLLSEKNLHSRRQLKPHTVWNWQPKTQQSSLVECHLKLHRCMASGSLGRRMV